MTPVDCTENIKKTGCHNHILPEEDINKKFVYNKIKSLAEDTVYPTSKVYSMATNKENVSELPILPKQSVYKNIQNLRKRKGIQINTETNLCEAGKTLRDDCFCLFDSGSNDNNRIVLIATVKNFLT